MIVVFIGVVTTAARLTIPGLVDLGTAVDAIDLRWLPVLPLLALGNVGLRFLRWTFLLRRIEAPVPLRQSLQIFLSGLAMALTPLSVGELLKALLLRRQAGTPLRVGAAVVVSERLYDVLALLLLGGLGVGVGLPTLAAVALGGLLIESLLHAPERGRTDARNPAATTWLVRVPQQAVAFAAGLGMSVAAWISNGFVLAAALHALGAGLPAAASVRTFATETPLGALSLIPGGTGVTGHLIIDDLGALGVPLAEAALAVILMRAATYWFGVGLGMIFLARAVRRRDAPAGALQQRHFEELAQEYAASIPEHVQRHVLEKKVEHMSPWLPDPATGLGLDMGCGHGWYMLELERDGHRIVGVDTAYRQLLEAQRSNGGDPARGPADTPPGRLLVQARGERLPLASGSASFAYCVNILHHITDADDQRRALDELARVVRPGGRIIIHEINITNPLFRFYMGYVFPLINDIDLGTERWLLPRLLAPPRNTRLETIEYFTFLPDFMPQRLLEMTRPVESWLETTRLRHWSAHYMAVFCKTGAATRID